MPDTAAAIAVDTAHAALTLLAPVQEQARTYAAQAKAASTLRAYGRDWRDFTAWCGTHGLPALPAAPDTVALYLTDRAATHRVATLHRRVAAISQAHQLAGHEPPTRAAAVRVLLAGIRRAYGTAQQGKAPVTTRTLRQLVDTLPDTLLGIRDRALLLLGFAGAFRRSELVGLDCKDVAVTSDGLVVTLRRSKTDQEGQGRKVGIPYGSTPATCPVRAIERWLAAAGIGAGPLFRGVNRHGQVSATRLTDQMVARVLKRCARSAGLEAESFAGHSLRAGLATSAAAAGVSERVIMAQTGHRSLPMVRRYIREGSLFRENAAAQVGL